MSTREKGTALHFVVVTYGNEDRRQFELRDAAAKSHAARVSYPKKRKLVVLKRKPVRVRRNVKRKDQNISVPVHCPSSNNSSLDPFVRLKVDLHLKERNLVHEYLTEIPKALYGTKTNGAFCPVRACTFEGIAANEIWLYWVLFLARYRQVVLSGCSTACDPDLLYYRSSAYQLLRREVADLDPKLTSLDDVFQGLAAASIAEARIGESANAQCHLEAGLKMVAVMKARGMPTPKFSGAGLIICGSFIAFGVLNYFKTSRQLLAAGRILFQRLRNMAVQNPVPRRNCLKSQAVTDSSPARDRYVNLRRAICKDESVLRRNICDQTHRTKTDDIRTRLAALFAVNLVIQNSRGKEAIAIGFLEELIHYLSNSTAHTPNDQPTQMSPTGVMYAISLCGSNLAQRYGSYYFDIWDIEDALEFIMLAEPETRGKLGKIMESWLFSDTADVTFNDKDEWAMIKEVNATWLARRAQLVGTMGSSGED